MSLRGTSQKQQRGCYVGRHGNLAEWSPKEINNQIISKEPFNKNLYKMTDYLQHWFKTFMLMIKNNRQRVLSKGEQTSSQSLKEWNFSNPLTKMLFWVKVPFCIKQPHHIF